MLLLPHEASWLVSDATNGTPLLSRCRKRSAIIECCRASQEGSGTLGRPSAEFATRCQFPAGRRSRVELPVAASDDTARAPEEARGGNRTQGAGVVISLILDGRICDMTQLGEKFQKLRPVLLPNYKIWRSKDTVRITIAVISLEVLWYSVWIKMLLRHNLGQI